MLKLHEGLWKAESTLLAHARTGRIGLAKFLYERRVPGVTTATCQCRAGQETPWHIALYCVFETSNRRYLLAGQNRTYPQMVRTKEGARHFI